jgi:hypothetical protein
LYRFSGRHDYHAVLLSNHQEQYMQQNIEHNAGESLAGDILRGADAIAGFLGLSLRQAFYGLQTGAIPAVKENSAWVTTKTRLIRHYNEGRYRPPAKRDLTSSVEG